jgi:FkbM family methyltransferase
MNSKLIYDVGMNNGDDTAYYLYCGYRVVAIEANPLLVDEAKQRFAKELEAGLLTVLNVGVAEQEGQFPFWVCETCSEWSSFDRSFASRDDSPHHAIMIPCRLFGSILAEFGVPYYLKVDIEGNDHLCLHDLDPGDLPEYVSVEGTDRDLIFQLRALGYKSFKCISQFCHLPVEWPPSREQRNYAKALWLAQSRNPVIRAFRRLGARRWVERRLNWHRSSRGWTFPYESSGPFGEDLPGRWQSADELAETHRQLEQMMRAGQESPFWHEKDYSFWTDFHARRSG